MMISSRASPAIWTLYRPKQQPGKVANVKLPPMCCRVIELMPIVWSAPFSMDVT